MITQTVGTKAINVDQPVPFLKWAGGKQWLASLVPTDLLAPGFTYFEPFLGGGAMFFALNPNRAVLGDTNGDLILAFQVVRRDVEAIIRRLQQMPYDPTHYYEVRANRPRTPIARCVRLIYLNRTCWNGLYRVNKNGNFNVPFGLFQNPQICNPMQLRTASNALASATLWHGDFETCLRTAKAGDLVYLDPPYLSATGESPFRRYGENYFSWDDFRRLARIIRDLDERGCRVLVSNPGDSTLGDALPSFQQHRVCRPSRLAADRRARGWAKEVLYSNFAICLRKVPSGRWSR